MSKRSSRSQSEMDHKKMASCESSQNASNQQATTLGRKTVSSSPWWFTSLFIVSLFLIWISPPIRGSNLLALTHYSPHDIDWNARREQVKHAFVTSWDGYKAHAWGKDVYHPISQKGSQMSPEGLGWMIIDSLDTMMVMNLSEQMDQSRRWLHDNLTYDQDQDVNTFETVIRMLGGLLAAHYLSTKLPDMSSDHDDVYLNQAIDLADRLLAAYDSPSGLPYSSVHLGKKQGLPSHNNHGASSTAEAATLQLELKYLSYLTDNEVYWRKAEKVIKIIDDHEMPYGLVPVYLSPETGNFLDPETRLGSRGDSYYEYLIKQYLQTSGDEPVYGDMWEEVVSAIQKHMVVQLKASGLKAVAEFPQGVGSNLRPKMDHLVCFLPGSIALGATGGSTLSEARQKPGWSAEKEQQIDLARDLMKTCWAMYAVTETGLAPEIVWFHTEEEDLRYHPNGRRARPVRDSVALWKEDFVIKPADAHNLQRPEVIESLFLLWRITEDPIYREWGWNIFEAFEKHTKVRGNGGYSSINDVNKVPPPQRDNMESFWLAETLKYLYLLFSPTDFLPLHDIVFNTEGHILPRFRQTKWKTGWERNMPRPTY